MGQNLEDAISAATRAVQFDTAEKYEQALYYYSIAVKIMSRLDAVNYASKVAEYNNRIEELQKIIAEKREKEREIANPNENQLQRCRFLLSQALDADESGCKAIAIKLYTEAVELGLSIKTVDEEMKFKLTSLIKKALDRAESLKGIRSTKDEPIPNLPSVPDTNLPDIENQTVETEESKINTTSNLISSNSNKPMRPTLHRGSSAHLKVVSGSSSYTDEEKRVLLHSSHIFNHEFVPFMNVDLTEKFQYAIPFTDKDGFLELSQKQKQDFARWCRPEELFAQPRMVMGHHVDYYSIKQTFVSDCSFVASLAVSAQYEKKFKRRLITSIIYPKNRNKDPIYNPFGKYMVKLHINGVPRKVIIDDYLPVNHSNQLLCSYSSNRGELWTSLLEKAYMKVMGGYDFPGSNSNIDLYALTGWIPERWAIRLNEPDFNKDQLFDILLTRLHKGDVLVTVATGNLSEADADRTGLVDSHAYAVLDARKINGERLLQLKNPWSHLRWRGNYSELDRKHWTKELQEALNYDPDSASHFDNGIFWIDYDSICHFFDVFYFNWNPKLFSYTTCIHQMWKAGIGPVKDSYNIGDNPQFSLEVQPEVSGAIWILLTRHITDIADFRQNKEYITVLVYKNDGKRVYYPHDPPPYIDGVRINSPHYLCKIKLNPESARKFTLVVSQYEKTTTIYYTLRVYATCPFVFRKMAEPYHYEKEIKDDQWKGITAGGCNPATYKNNPIYQLVLQSSHNNNYLLLILKGPKQFDINLHLITVVLNEPEAAQHFEPSIQGPYRPGFVYLELENVPAGTYNVIPSAMIAGQEAPFFLTVKASCNIQLNRLQ